MEEQRFDDLARLVASKTSRRQMLKVIAGAAVGGLLGGRLNPVWASGGNSACAHFCNTVFGENTAAAEQCTSDRTLCASTCNGGSGTLCGPQSGGYYTSYSSTHCCSGLTPTCSSGTCTAGCDTSTCAGCSPICAGSTCTCGAGTVAITTKNNTTTCVKPCYFSNECATDFCGGTAGANSGYCTHDLLTDRCATDADCPAGSFCSSYGNGAGIPGNYLCSVANC